MQLIKRVAVLAMLAVLVSGSALLIYLNGLKRKADLTIHSSYELFKQNHRPTLGELRQRFGRDLRQSSTCGAEGCGYEVEVSNRFLARLNSSNYTVLKSRFWTRDDAVEENVLELVAAKDGRLLAVAYVDAKYCEGCKDYVVAPCAGSMREMASGSVRVGSDSDTNEKRTAFGFNTGCLTRRQACATLAELNGSVWQTTSTGNVQCTNHLGATH